MGSHIISNAPTLFESAVKNEDTNPECLAKSRQVGKIDSDWPVLSFSPNCNNIHLVSKYSIIFFLFFLAEMSDAELSNDEFEFDENDLPEQEFIDDEEEVNGNEDAVDYDAPSKSAEELEKQKLQRKEQKELAMQRKMQKPHAEMIVEAKRIWEEVRQKRLTKQQRRELMDKMMSIVGDKVVDVISS
jgi:hypothetical protein